MNKRLPCQSMRHPSAGFTLIEMMVVLIIAAILAGMAVGGFQWLVQSQRARNSAFELYASLMVARSEAIKRNGNVTITPADGGWQNGWTITSGAETIKTQPPITGITVAVGAPVTVVYTQTGRFPAGAAAAAFELNSVGSTLEQNKRCIRVTLSGMPQTAKGPCP